MLPKQRSRRRSLSGKIQGPQATLDDYVDDCLDSVYLGYGKCMTAIRGNTYKRYYTGRDNTKGPVRTILAVLLLVTLGTLAFMELYSAPVYTPKPTMLPTYAPTENISERTLA